MRDWKRDMEEKRVIQKTQSGFRRGSTMDNVYVLQHVIKKEIQKKEESLGSLWTSKRHLIRQKKGGKE